MGLETNDAQLIRSMAVALATTRRAHEFARANLSATGEMEDLGKARAAACNAAEAYCKRTGFPRGYFERMLLDGDLPVEGLISAALDIVESLTTAVQKEPEPIRVQVDGITRAAVRLGAHWAIARNVRPADVDERLISLAAGRTKGFEV